MKKLLFWLATSAITFFIGLIVFCLYYFSFIPEIAKPPHLPAPENFDCVKSKGFPGLSQEISKLKKGKSDYFPRKIFGNNMSPKHSVAGWYGKHLKAMTEESLLSISNEDKEVYRFLWLRTFHHPIFVRVEREDYAIELFTQELNGAGGYAPGEVLRSGEFSITEEEFCNFKNLLEKANYWYMPTESNELGGNDGAEWILEGVKDNRYHIVDRWTPQKGEYREACIYLLKLSGVDVDRLKDDLY